MNFKTMVKLFRRYKSRFNQTPNDVENNIENKVLDDLRAKELQNSYTNKKQYKTMGPAKVALRRPDEFLKSKEKCFVPPQGTNAYHNCL